MKYFKAGQFFGQSNQTISLDGVTVTETVYDYEFIDWHYHENPHFSFVLFGNTCEGNSRETYECSADTLLFHNWQEPHYNVKPAGLTRGFQLEMNHAWCNKFELDWNRLPDPAKIMHPNVRLLFYNIYKEAKLRDETATLTIDALLNETLATMRGVANFSDSTTPRWVKKIDEILHESFTQPLSLLELATELNLHWAHLSRDFRKYFRCNFSEYVRKIKVEKSLSLLRNKNLSLTDIAMRCGFADQSHFIRCFKEFTGITPKAFRNVIN